MCAASLHICTGLPESRHNEEISYAGSNGDLCTVQMNSKCCGESALATMAHMCNHQCVVSMREKMFPMRCNKIPQYNFLLVYQDKIQSCNCFLDVISWEYDNSCA